MSGRGAVAFAVALVAFLAAGLWLGGHPGSLPEPLREVFVAEPGGLTAEAAEAIEDNYYRPVGGQRARATPRCRGWSGSCANATGGPLHRILLPGSARKLQPADRRPLLGDRADGDRSEEGPAGRRGLPALARRRRPGSSPATRSSRSKANRSPARAAPKRRRRSKGPEGTQVTIGVRDAKSGKVRRADHHPGRGGAAQRQQQGQEGRRARSSATSACSASAKAPTRSSPRRCEKVEKEGAEGIVLDLRHNPGGLLEEAVLSASLFLPEGRSRGLDQIADPGRQRPQDLGERSADAAGGRPDRRRHRLGGRDPRRGAGRRRRRRPWSAPAPTARALFQEEQTSPTAAP